MNWFHRLQLSIFGDRWRLGCLVIFLVAGVSPLVMLILLDATADQRRPDTAVLDVRVPIDGAQPALGEVTIQYPRGWDSQTTGDTVIVVNDDAVFGIGPGEFASGQFGLTVLLVLPDDALDANTVDGRPVASTTDVIALYDPSLPLDSVDVFQAGGRPVALYTQFNLNEDIGLLSVRGEAGYVLMAITTAPDEIDDFNEQIRFIAENLTYVATDG